MHLALLASSFAALRLACDTSVAVGDGMQAIYAFLGADSGALAYIPYWGLCIWLLM